MAIDYRACGSLLCGFEISPPVSRGGAAGGVVECAVDIGQAAQRRQPSAHIARAHSPDIKRRAKSAADGFRGKMKRIGR